MCHNKTRPTYDETINEYYISSDTFNTLRILLLTEKGGENNKNIIL